MAYEPVHHGICIIDIEGFGRLDRKNTTRIQMRDALYDIFGQGLRQASIRESDLTLKDQGDGILALFDPQVPKSRLIHPLVSQLVAGLDAYNRIASEEGRMRLRVAIHAGEVVRHGSDHIGEDLNHAFRLLDCKTLRRWLAAVDTPLALIVSQLVYDGMVKHGYPGIDASGYRPVRVTVKETIRAPAWIWMPRDVVAGAGHPETVVV